MIIGIDAGFPNRKVFDIGADLKLVLPPAARADEIKDFRSEFIENKSSTDGHGPLQRIEDPLEWIAWSRAQEKRETCSPDLVPATQFLL